MLSFTTSQRYFLYPGPVDMRKGFDSLSGLVTSQMRHSLTSGDVFIFINKNRNKIKLLVWDRSGLVIYYKRLEEGTFEMPLAEEGATSLSMSWDRLVLLLEGISLASIQRRKRYTKSG